MKAMKAIKKTICTLLACTILCVTCAAMMTSCTIELVGSSRPRKFEKSDTTVKGVSLGMTVAQVKEKLGEPNSETVEDDNFFLPGSTTFEYDGIEMVFYADDINKSESDRVLNYIMITSEKVRLNNGLHVGSSKQSVISAFTSDGKNAPFYTYANKEEPAGVYLYGGFSQYEISKQEEADVYQFAYINESLSFYSYIEYFYCEIVEHGKYTLKGDLYELKFGIDTITNKVDSIIISCDYNRSL